jgi:hypothetical protein
MKYLFSFPLYIIITFLLILSPVTIKAQTTIIEGTITRVDPPAIDIKTEQGVQRFTVPQTVPVQKEDKLISLQELAVNDKVTIEQSPQNEILNIRVQPASLNDIVPFIIGGVILLATIIIVLLAAKKTNKKFIKTSVSTKGE